MKFYNTPKRCKIKEELKFPYKGEVDNYYGPKGVGIKIFLLGKLLFKRNNLQINFKAKRVDQNHRISITFF